MVHHTPASVRGDDAQTIGKELLSQYDLSIFDIEILHRQTKATIVEASGHPASLQYLSLLHTGDSVGSFHERAFPHSSGRQRGRPPKPLHEKFAKRARNDAWNFRDNHGKKIELTPVVPEHVTYDDCCSCQLCCLEPLFDETVLLFKHFWRIFVPNIREVFFSMTPTADLSFFNVCIVAAITEKPWELEFLKCALTGRSSPAGVWDGGIIEFRFGRRQLSVEPAPALDIIGHLEFFHGLMLSAEDSACESVFCRRCLLSKLEAVDSKWRGRSRRHARHGWGGRACEEQVCGS